MLTQCPNCETTFRVTADILRVADGQVRCGRCQTQFDALERLIEEGDPNSALSGRFLHTQSQPDPEPIAVEEPDSMEEITMDGNHIEISGTYRIVDEASGEAEVRQETVEEWAQIDDDRGNVEQEEAEQSIEMDAQPSIDDEPEAPPIEAAPPIRATRAPFGSRLNREPPPAEEVRDDFALLNAELPARATPLIWKLLALPLVLLLVAQIVHHHRAELARHPTLGEPLIAIYGALGLRLTPDWNLHAYGVKQWGVVMDPAHPGTLKVRASITNGAKFAQPQPLLRLVLEDRWGDQVRAREFEPADYLDPGIAPDRLLAPGQQTNATISIVDPGPDAEGFRFDVCLPGASGPVCAADVPSTR